MSEEGKDKKKGPPKIDYDKVLDEKTDSPEIEELFNKIKSRLSRLLRAGRSQISSAVNRATNYLSTAKRRTEIAQAKKQKDLIFEKKLAQEKKTFRLAIKIIFSIANQVVTETFKKVSAQSRQFITNLNFKELLYMVVGPPIEAWHILRHDIIYPFLRRRAWSFGRQTLMIRERMGVPEYAAGTGFQRFLSKMNFFKAKQSPLGYMQRAVGVYRFPHPDEAQEFWKREQKTLQVGNFLNRYFDVMGETPRAVDAKIYEAFKKNQWVPEMEVMKGAPPTRLQINWQRRRMELSRDVGEYWKSVGSTYAYNQREQLFNMLDVVSTRDGGRLKSAWLLAKQKQQQVLDHYKKSIVQNDIAHPAEKEEYRRKMTRALILWRDSWNWANPSQFFPWGGNDFHHEVYTQVVPYKQRAKASIRSFFYYLGGGNRSFAWLDVGHALVSSNAARLVLLFYGIVGIKSYETIAQTQPWKIFGEFFSDLDQPYKACFSHAGVKVQRDSALFPTLDPFSFEVESRDVPVEPVPYFTDQAQLKKDNERIKQQIALLRKQNEEARYMQLLPSLQLKYLEWKYPQFSESGSKILHLRRRWEQEDISSQVYREKKKKERMEEAKAFRWNAEFGETAKRMKDYRNIQEEMFSDHYRREAEHFRNTEGVPEWPETMDYRNDYYWRVKLKTPFPPGFAGDFLRKLEDENFIRHTIHNPNIYNPQGAPESEHDYVLLDSLKRRLHPELYTNEDIEIPNMVKYSKEASWHTPGQITPLTEDYAVPEITPLRGWRQGGQDPLVQWPTPFDDPMLYTDWSKEVITPHNIGVNKNPANSWNWDKTVPSTWLYEDATRMARYANYTTEQGDSGTVAIWDHLADVDPSEELDDIDADYFYQNMRNVDNDFEHGNPMFDLNHDPTLSNEQNHIVNTMRTPL